MAGNHSAETGAKIIETGLVNLVAFGRKFFANLDLPYRFEHELPLNDIGDPSSLLGGDACGYTDYLLTLPQRRDSLRFFP